MCRIPICLIMLSPSGTFKCTLWQTAMHAATPQLNVTLLDLTGMPCECYQPIFTSHSLILQALKSRFLCCVNKLSLYLVDNVVLSLKLSILVFLSTIIAFSKNGLKFIWSCCQTSSPNLHQDFSKGDTKLFSDGN